MVVWTFSVLTEDIFSQNASVDWETFEDVRIGVQTILDSVASFMAAHDASGRKLGRQYSNVMLTSTFALNSRPQQLRAAAQCDARPDTGPRNLCHEQVCHYWKNGKTRPHLPFCLCSYFGIGLDAKIAFDFDQLRNEHPEKCRSRVKNQMWYALMGSRQMLAQSCRNLHRRIKLECDGVVVKLPKLQGVVVLNIPSYMGGAELWGTPRPSKGFQPQSISDGFLEVVGIKGSSEVWWEGVKRCTLHLTL